MNLTGGAWRAYNNNKAIRNSIYGPIIKQSETVTDFKVANTKDLDPLARGKGLVDPEEATALENLLRCLQLRKRAKRAAPGGVFCMSGPVAHVDEEEEEKDSKFFYIFPESSNGSHHNQFESTLNGEKAMPNGDMYVGAWNRSLPEGRGKYLWADGCMYEGQWCRGQKTGKGKLSWPSGATYEGSFMGGYLHGYGTFTGVDGATYRGQWLLNDKHGHGHKCYKNGDFYEGSWKYGVQEGHGRYIWGNGNEYVGEWKRGLMCGRGVMSWSSGDKYDGQWLDGLGHGHGVYKWADGSYYSGTWSKGLKDGKGTFYSACGNHSRFCRCVESSTSSLDQHDDLSDDGRSFWKERSSSMSDFEVYLNASCAQSSEIREPSLRRTFSFDGIRTSSSEESEDNEEGSSTCDADNFLVQPAVDREYVQGVLINEVSRVNVPCKASKRRHTRHPKERKRQGEIIYKGHRNYDLMLNLQLGIRYTVGKITPVPKRDIFPADFDSKASIWMRFPPEGSACTPPHHSVEFRWKDYCPMVFRHLRELFKIDAADYMLSICGNDALRELSSPGKSGSVFYLSHNDRFMIKTMRKSEVKVLLRMLPNYYNHVRTYGSTLITKFFGLHGIKAAGGQKVQFIVMGNMFCSELRIHRRFDLKGSSQGRSTDKVEIDETTTLKDLDLDFVFQLEPSWRQALLRQIECDCNFLEAERIMDYSLLLGLHLRAPQYSTVFSPNNSSTEPDVEMENTDLVLPGTARLGIRLGVNMPARANRRLPRVVQDSPPEGELFGEDYDVVLYFGIIDILQDYDIAKRLEHAYKSLQFDSHSISAVDPKLYSKRFQDFINRIFPGNS
ncbi:hypothetical protein KI387_025456 [Taxus chinensis]|uniref:1-phosphatidylinositol-4-phosphate 5-kinase n=1 Tax=Taxus chinensis TaxID=29808 RepID=A0AA38FTP6_TAXCH|nr:hypothetical protein KI387_025456 [Taxus chinensis]